MGNEKMRNDLFGVLEGLPARHPHRWAHSVAGMASRFVGENALERCALKMKLITDQSQMNFSRETQLSSAFAHDRWVAYEAISGEKRSCGCPARIPGRRD